MKKILVLGDLSKKKIFDTISGLKPWLEKHVIAEVIDLSKERKFEKPGAEIAVVFGGGWSSPFDLQRAWKKSDTDYRRAYGTIWFSGRAYGKERMCFIGKNIYRELSGAKKDAPFVPS